MKKLFLFLLLSVHLTVYGQRVRNFADEMPEYSGLTDWLIKNLPSASYDTLSVLPERLRFSFIIDTNGRVRNASLIQPEQLRHETWGRLLLQRLTAMQGWTPGRVQGRKVPVRFTLPVTVCFLE